MQNQHILKTVLMAATGAVAWSACAISAPLQTGAGVTAAAPSLTEKVWCRYGQCYDNGVGVGGLVGGLIGGAIAAGAASEAARSGFSDPIHRQARRQDGEDRANLGQHGFPYLWCQGVDQRFEFIQSAAPLSHFSVARKRLVRAAS